MRVLLVFTMLNVLAQATYADGHRACGALVSQISRSSDRNKEVSPELEQFLYWEQYANSAEFTKEASEVEIPIARVDAKEVRFEFISADWSSKLKSLFMNSDGTVRWPKHPTNTSPVVPFYDQAAVSTMSAQRTASRSLFFMNNGMAFTIKLGTNWPSGPNGKEIPFKAETNQDIESGLRRSKMIFEVDKKLGVDPEFQFLLDVGAVYDKKTRMGGVIRDLTPLQDGFLYLPAFSIPFVGREIASRFGEDYFSFWRKHYAEKVGRAKALILLRYGLLMESPNAQNILIQLDKDMRPTGKILFRDAGDTDIIEAVSQGLGFSTHIEKDKKHGYQVSSDFDLVWSATAYRFSEPEANPPLDEKSNKEWRRAHNKAFVRAFEEALHLKVHTRVYNDNSVQTIVDYLKTKDGQRRMKKLGELRDE